MTNQSRFTVEPYPRGRTITADGGRLAARRHMVHGFIEVDVTLARQAMRDHEARTGERLSFTAFVIACVGQAVEDNRYVHASRDWRGRIVVFDEVNVNTIVEVQRGGLARQLPLILRGANRKSFREIHDEMRAFQHKPDSSGEARYLRMFNRLPRLARDVFYWWIFRSPRMLHRQFGTVGLTAVGMFFKGRSGWGLPFTNHTLGIAVGSIAEKPCVVEGRIEAREVLHLTVSFDHDIVDGAPAARFTRRLADLLEGGYGLDDLGGVEDTTA